MFDLKKLHEEIDLAKSKNDYKKWERLCRDALINLPESESEPRGEICYSLAKCIVLDEERPDRAIVLEDAIGSLDSILERTNPLRHPNRWPALHGLLAIAYMDRSEGDIEKNLLSAKKYMEVRLKDAIDREPSEITASYRSIMGEICAELGRFGSAYFDMAIEHFREALLVYDEKHYPDEFHELQTTISRVIEDKEDNVHKYE